MDVARILALAVVVLGHLSLAVVDRRHGALRGANLLALRPHWAWAAALAPMPVFFAAAGWANATATVEVAATRLRALVGTALVVVCGWSATVIAVRTIPGHAGIAGDGARIATQPLWFLAAYLPLAASGRAIARAADRHGPALIAAGLAVLAALDLARFAGPAPSWIGWPGFFLAWGTPWVAGAWWRSRCGDAGWRAERRAGATLAAIAAAAAVALVATAGYSPALIDVVPGARSNTTPPTLYTAVVALAQVGGLWLAAGWLDAIGRRWRPLWDRAGEAAVGVYVWHLTALALCVGLVAAGMPTPRRLTAIWWLTRPLWWALVLGVSAVLVGSSAAARARLARRPAGRLTATSAWAGVLLTALAAGVVGLRGPRSAVLALACSSLFAGGWALLRGSGGRVRLQASRPRPRPGRTPR